MLVFKTYHSINAILNSNYVAKFGLYAFRSTNNVISIIGKSNSGHFDIITVAINLWNTLQNTAS